MTPEIADPLPRVSDASPLIGLAKVGCLDLLAAGRRTVLITATVANEILAGQAADPARLALEAGWGERRADSDIPRALLAWRLDAGEESALALALRIGAVAVLDDADGRRAARALGIPHTGTAGIVAEGRRLGLIPFASDLLRDLQAAGVYLPPDPLLAALLTTLGESWP